MKRANVLPMLLCVACDPLPGLNDLIPDLGLPDGPQSACAAVPMRDGTDPVAFLRGCLLFTHEFTAMEGLGPNFNGPEGSCAGCHTIPGLGGGGDLTHVVHLAGPRFVGGVEQMFQMGSPIRTSSSLVGSGILDDLTDQDIISGCGPGGRTAESGGSGRVGRFGRKSPAVDVRAFTAGAAFQEQGLSNHGSPFEMSSDGGPDELTPAEVIDLATFVRGLSSLRRLPVDPLGSGLFGQVGCAACHRPDRLYTDLCVHDLGMPMMDDEEHAQVAKTEWRTAKLVDVQAQTSYLHDGRAHTIDEAIHLGHSAGSAAATASVTAFDALSNADRDALVRFVLSL